MHYLGIIGNIWSLIKKFIEERKFYIRTEGFRSAEFKSVVGLPQGSVLSPVLFNIFVFDMCCDIFGRSFKYADDLTILSSGLNAARALEVMQGNIEVLATWLNNWRMLASLTKTKAMILHKKTTISEAQTSLIFEGHQIKITDAVKVLGVIIDDKLNFGQQYTAATNGAIQTLESIKRSYLSNKSISPNTFKTLCQSIVVPKWTYLAFIWGNREKFRNSQLWAEIVNFSTCST